MMNTVHDTIAAIATPPGLGGIAIVRMSGPDALAFARDIFFPAGGGPCAFTPRHMHFGHVRDREGQPLDEALAVYMPGPHSATGEDVVEIHCHGGVGVSTALLETVLATGARLAAPGEFTRRAFLSGRLDLTQAEAVAELIHAPTTAGVRLAGAKLSGLLGKKITALRASLDALRIQVALAVDFPEEDAELLSPEAFLTTIRSAQAEVAALLSGFERARLWREGASAVLVGCVNAGKSSLFNALLGRQRALVSPRAGTTRDYLEEAINLDGMPLRILDTAGLRQGEDSVEQEGIARSLALAEEADILLLVVDAEKGMGAEEETFLARHEETVRQGKVLLILNKQDKLSAPGTFPATLPPCALTCPCFAVSALDGSGLDALARGVKQAVLASHGVGGASPTGGDIAPNLRQSILLKKAAEELAALLEDVDAGMPADILGVRLDFLVHTLDEVTGTTDNEALLDRIFASFCIGK